MNEAIRVHVDNAIATVELNRPEKLNALDLAMWLDLSRVFGELDADATLRCVVVRGAGDEAFTAGGDITAFETERHDVEQAKRYGRAEIDGVMAIFNCRHPTVALIQGTCVGGGLEIACACDIRVCGASSRFGVPIARIGVTMSYEELEFFIRVVGRSAALRILLEGDVFGAQEAKELGVVHRVVDDEAVTDEAYRAANRVCRGAPLVNRWHKKFVHRLDDKAPLSDDERAEPFETFATEDFRRGVQAFLDKQRPDFRGD